MTMTEIDILSNETIDKIAAGEVVERPLNVVKELVENSIDAGSAMISVEIKGGGIDLIRVTDNGSGIDESQCEKAFLRHATSKLHTIEDLNTLVSLGFRGEALSSICAVSKAEMITKPKESFLGTHLLVEGGKLNEKSKVGAPDGTTIIIRTLFYNTPPRKKFLKSPSSEGAQIQEIMEKFALSRPDIAFQFISNGKTLLSTSGNNNLKDVVYHIFGKDVYNSLLEVDYEGECVKITGFTAKPEFTYQSRGGELYFVNGRCVKSKIINTAIEEVYRNYLMQHRFPFCVLLITVASDTIDVNVHPQKLEVKFSDNKLISDCVMSALNEAFNNKDLIPTVTFGENVKPEYSVLKDAVAYIHDETPKRETFTDESEKPDSKVKTDAARESDSKVKSDTVGESDSQVEYAETVKPLFVEKENVTVKPLSEVRVPEPFEVSRKETVEVEKAPTYVQENFFERHLISDKVLREVKIIGQVFDTYWICQLDNDMYIIDQHAAHEKVNYEKLVKRYNENLGLTYSQSMNPPLIIHLSPVEAETLLKYMDVFTQTGFEFDDFGMGSFALRSIPLNLYGIDSEELFHRLLNELMEKEGIFPPTFVLEKLASLSCKAAIKGNQRISYTEAQTLLNQLMELENPYNCPHGRPVFIKITKTEMEKKFKRIVE